MTTEFPARLIYPCPRAVTWGDGLLAIGRQVRLQLPANVADALSSWMQELWRKFTLGQSRLEIVRSEATGFTFTLMKHTAVPLPSGDSYALQIGATGAAATAKDLTALRHAWLTLVQMLQPDEAGNCQLPQAGIQDRPAMVFRGLHLCVFPETTLEFLEKVIHLAGVLKYSHLVLEFWGMLKLEALPELAWPQAHTKKQVQPLLDTARRYGLEIVPMYNAWGHAASSRMVNGRHVVLDQNPRLAPLFEPDGWTWCLSNARSRAILKNVVAELCEWVGPGQYFHIGCDEAYSHATCDRCRQQDRIGLWVQHVNDLAEQLGAAGRRPIMWGDALLERAAWPMPFEANGQPYLPTHTAIDRLSRRIVIADWHYDVCEGDVPTQAHFCKHGFDVLAAPWHEYGNIRALARAARANSTLGLLATTWHRLPAHMAMLVAAANAAWTCEPLSSDRPEASWSLMNSTLASLQRKLVPAGGAFARAGWSPTEITA